MVCLIFTIPHNYLTTTAQLSRSCKEANPRTKADGCSRQDVCAAGAQLFWRPGGDLQKLQRLVEVDLHAQVHGRCDFVKNGQHGLDQVEPRRRADFQFGH